MDAAVHKLALSRDQARQGDWLRHTRDLIE